MKASSLSSPLSSSSSSSLTASTTTATTTTALLTTMLLSLLLLSSPTIINAQDILRDDANNNSTQSLLLAGDSSAINESSTISQSLSNEELASYGLNLSEFNKVRLTESPIDFGQSEGLAYNEETNLMVEGLWDTDILWMDAAIFEYEVATSHTNDVALTSIGYHPYLICSTNPKLSGSERDDAINELFQNTPNISSSHYYSDGNLFINTDEISCGVVRAFDDTIHKVYMANPNAKLYMYVNPLHASMKMVQNTVEVLESWGDGTNAGDVVSINEMEEDEEEEGSSNRITVRAMGIRLVLCPGVQDFNGQDIDDDEIVNDIKTFITKDGGEYVKSLSFYHHVVQKEDDDDEEEDGAASVPDRMKQWSNAVSTVTNWTRPDGTNACLDELIGNSMEFHVNGKSLEVTAVYSMWEKSQILESLGFTDEQGETCIWYMTYALAVSPMVCSLQPRTEVRTLCADGTSDLSKCPEDESDESSGGSSSSSSSIRIGRVGVVTALISSVVVLSSAIGIVIF